MTEAIVLLQKDGEKLPYDPTPMAHSHFGQPEDVGDLLNKYGTYNIQPTNEQENLFPAIMQGLPSQWRDKEVTKEDLEQSKGEES